MGDEMEGQLGQLLAPCFAVRSPRPARRRCCHGTAHHATQCRECNPELKVRRCRAAWDASIAGVGGADIVITDARSAPPNTRRLAHATRQTPNSSGSEREQNYLSPASPLPALFTSLSHPTPIASLPACPDAAEIPRQPRHFANVGPAAQHPPSCLPNPSVTSVSSVWP